MSRLLIIDDDSAIRWVLQRNLEHSGFSVVTAENGLDGLSKIGESTPDLVVLDLMMPVMDGFGVLEALRSDPITSRIPVIVLTAVAATEMQARCLQAGARRVMTKPFEPSRLTDAINDLLDEPATKAIG